jgi:hypothetical protein
LDTVCYCRTTLCARPCRWSLHRVAFSSWRPRLAKILLSLSRRWMGLLPTLSVCANQRRRTVTAAIMLSMTMQPCVENTNWLCVAKLTLLIPLCGRRSAE